MPFSRPQHYLGNGRLAPSTARGLGDGCGQGEGERNDFLFSARGESSAVTFSATCQARYCDSESRHSRWSGKALLRRDSVGRVCRPVADVAAAALDHLEEQPVRAVHRVEPEKAAAGIILIIKDLSRPEPGHQRRVKSEPSRDVVKVVGADRQRYKTARGQRRGAAENIIAGEGDVLHRSTKAVGDELPGQGAAGIGAVQGDAQRAALQRLTVDEPAGIDDIDHRRLMRLENRGIEQRPACHMS